MISNKTDPISFRLNNACGIEIFPIDKFCRLLSRNRLLRRLLADAKTGSGFLESPVWGDSRFLQPPMKEEIRASLEDDFSPAGGKSPFGWRVGGCRFVKE